MRIGIDVRPFLKEETGVGVYLKNLLFSLSQVDDQNEYYLFSASWKDRFPLSKVPPLLKKRFRHFRLPVTLINYGWYHWGWPPFDCFFGRKMDIVHSPTPIVIPTFGQKIITIYDLFFLREPKLADKTAGQFFRKRLKKSVDEAQAIITISRSSAQEILSFFPEAEKKVRVIYLGIDAAFWTLADKEKKAWSRFKQEQGLPAEYFLFVGAFEPRKNLPALIKAFHFLQQWGKEEYLVLVGRQGKDFPQVITLSNQLGLGKKVIIKDYTSPAHLRYYYHGAKALIVPSLAEGFGLPLLEAMASGLPIIASQTPAIPEVAGEAALYFDPRQPEDIATKIEQFLEQPNLKKGLVRAGYQRVNSFTWLETARQTLKVYQELGP